MKKLLISMLSLAAIAFVACAGKSSNADSAKAAAQQPAATEASSDTLVVYFSATGVTKDRAEKLADVTGADLMEIVPSPRYTDADLDWTNDKSRSSVNMHDLAKRPPIEKPARDASQYKVSCVRSLAPHLPAKPTTGFAGAPGALGKTA